jgi:hypothetical protein
VPRRLPNSCPDCNGCVSLESMLCEACGSSMLPRLTVPEVYELLYPECTRIEGVDAFIDDVLGA